RQKHVPESLRDAKAARAVSAIFKEEFGDVGEPVGKRREDTVAQERTDRLLVATNARSRETRARGHVEGTQARAFEALLELEEESVVVPFAQMQGIVLGEEVVLALGVLALVVDDESHPRRIIREYSFDGLEKAAAACIPE